MYNEAHGAGCPFIRHVFYFNSYPTGKIEDAKYKAEFEKEVCLNLSKGIITQTTLTQTQMEDNPQVLEWHKELGFKNVFAHINPNTKRKIYTFMNNPDPELYEGEVRKQSFSKNFYTDMYNRSNGATRYGDCDILNYHGGGCCGHVSAWGVQPLGNYIKNCEQIGLIIGMAQTYAPKDIAVQFALPLSEVMRTNDDGYALYHILEKSGFEGVHKFTPPSTGQQWVLYMYSTARIPNITI